jgi:hypothetical protein
MPSLRRHTSLLAALAAACLALPAAASAQSGGAVGVPSGESGGALVDAPELETPAEAGRPGRARIVDGRAVPPAGAPARVVAAIRAANRIVGKPYKWGGGHARAEDSGYDCSGTVSYALRGAGVLDAPLPSGPLMRWGRRGRGRWITVYANAGHAYVVIAGLRLDTSSAGERRSSGRGPRWRTTSRSPRGFVARHPRGL